MHTVENFRMDEYRNDDVFGFLDEANEVSGQDGSSSIPEFGLTNGPSKDAVLFCIDCAKFAEISRGLSIKSSLCHYPR